jgi:ribose transport system ATP-binding protein
LKKEVLEIRRLSKKVGNHYTLNNLSFSLYEGELLGITGKNNSGIIDLLSVLSGESTPDSGSIVLNHQPLNLGLNFSVQSQGIAVISQNTTLLESFTVEENIGLSWVAMKNRHLIRKKMIHAITRDLLVKYGIPIDPTTKVQNLNSYQKTALQVLIACLHGAKVIVMHDIIRSLTKASWLRILELINTLKAENVSFITISYDYKMLKSSDRIIVLRSGSIGGIFYHSEYNLDDIYKVMTQKSFLAPKLSPLPQHAPLVLEAKKIRIDGHDFDIDFSIRAGEVIGFVTKESEPFYEIIQMFNSEVGYTGQLFLLGQELIIKDRATTFEKGICCAKRYGSSEFVFPNLSVSENILMMKYRDFSSYNILNINMCRFAMKEYEKVFDRSNNSWNVPIDEIEPQIQFDLFLNKWFAMKPKIIMLDNLFAGADIDMQNSIYEFINKAKGLGIGMIFYSTVQADLSELCDTVYQVG